MKVGGWSLLLSRQSFAGSLPFSGEGRPNGSFASSQGRSTLGAPLPTNGCRLAAALFLLSLFLIAFPAGAAEQNGRWAILLAGASGDPDLKTMYLKELTDLYSILTNRLEFARDQVFVLYEDPSLNQELIRFKSTAENLRNVCRNLAGRVKKDDLVFVFVEGHASYDGKVYKFNMVGPDSTAEELAAALYAIPTQRFVIVNATNCSGGSLPALSRQGSILITATKSGMEKNQTHMGRYFIEALENDAADSDKNGRVSILEAFAYLSKKVEGYYEGEGSLQTEHPVLDDNGDVQAQAKPSAENGEGLLAGTTFLDTGSRAGNLENLPPEQLELAQAAREIEKQIETLKYAKSKMPEAEYEKRLEDLLLRLARINAKQTK